MAYSLKEVTIGTDNTPEGMEKISRLWADITAGRLPVLFDSEHNFKKGISPVSRYSNYATDETGEYDLSIMGVTSDFFGIMEEKTAEGLYRKYDVSDDSGDIEACTRRAWAEVWEDRKAGRINRAFTEDYESAVPAEYTKDKKAHCYLWIAVK